MKRNVAMSAVLLAALAALGCGERTPGGESQEAGRSTLAEAGPVTVTVYKSPT